MADELRSILARVGEADASTLETEVNQLRFDVADWFIELDPFSTLVEASRFLEESEAEQLAVLLGSAELLVQLGRTESDAELVLIRAEQRRVVEGRQAEVAEMVVGFLEGEAPGSRVELRFRFTGDMVEFFGKTAQRGLAVDEGIADDTLEHVAFEAARALVTPGSTEDRIAVFEVSASGYSVVYTGPPRPEPEIHEEDIQARIDEIQRDRERLVDPTADMEATARALVEGILAGANLDSTQTETLQGILVASLEEPILPVANFVASFVETAVVTGRAELEALGELVVDADARRELLAGIEELAEALTGPDSVEVARALGEWLTGPLVDPLRAVLDENAGLTVFSMSVRNQTFRAIGQGAGTVLWEWVATLVLGGLGSVLIRSLPENLPGALRRYLERISDNFPRVRDLDLGEIAQFIRQPASRYFNNPDGIPGWTIIRVVEDDGRSVLRAAPNGSVTDGPMIFVDSDGLIQLGSQWTNTQELLDTVVGQVATSTALPDGYRLIRVQSGPYIRRNPGRSSDLAPLRIDENGTIQIGTGSPTGRLAVSGRLAANLDTAGFARPGGGAFRFQAHHLIPDNVYQSHSLTRLARELDAFDIDDARNGMWLPADEIARDSAAPGLPLHNTNHVGYDAIVRGLLDEFERDLRGDLGDLESIPRDQLREHVADSLAELSEELRVMIEGSGWTTLRDVGGSAP